MVFSLERCDNNLGQLYARGQEPIVCAQLERCVDIDQWEDTDTKILEHQRLKTSNTLNSDVSHCSLTKP
jgi:hypothetical protein